jgi:cell division protease FtsH
MGARNGSAAPEGSVVTPGDPATQAAIDARAEEGASRAPEEHPPTEVIEVPDGGRVEP